MNKALVILCLTMMASPLLADECGFFYTCQAQITHPSKLQFYANGKSQPVPPSTGEASARSLKIAIIESFQDAYPKGNDVCNVLETIDDESQMSDAWIPEKNNDHKCRYTCIEETI